MYSVILADDEPVILEGLSYIVPWNTLGFEIKAKVYDGDELIAAVKEYSPDVLITDIQMPAHTGLECIEEIRQSIDRLIEMACTDNKQETVRMMKAIAPDYVSQHSIYEKLDKN